MSWPLVALGDLGRIITGSTPKTSEEGHFGGAIPFVTPSDLGQGEALLSTPRSLTDGGAGQVRLVPAGTVMVSCIGTLGKVGIAGVELATNQQINSIVFDTKKVWPRYGLRAAQRLSPIMEQMAPATTLPIISKSKFEKLQIPLPPLDEQRRIAAILDQADDLRRKRREAIALTRELVSSEFRGRFADFNRNGSVSVPRLVPIASFCRTGSGTTPPRSNAEAYYGGGIPWVKSGELREAEILETEETVTDQALRETPLKLVPPGSLLVAMYGATVGRVAILGVPATTNQAVCHLVPDPQIADTQYMFHALQNLAPYFISRGAGGAQPNISQGLIQQTEIFLPPLDEQNAFAQFAKAAEDQLASFTRHSTQLDTLFASLQHRAFSGEL